MAFALEERFNPQRFSQSSPMSVSARLPGALSEVVLIESQQWVESIDDGQRCVLCAQHEVTARMRAVGSTLEKQLESRIRLSCEAVHRSEYILDPIYLDISSPADILTFVPSDSRLRARHR